MIDLVPTNSRWPKVPLGEMCDIRGGFPAPQDESAFEDGTIPFVRMKDVGRHHFTNNLCETGKSLSRAHFETGRYQLTPRGSILMPRSGSVALNHRAVLGMDAVIVSHLCALVPISDRIVVDYLYHFLCLADMRKLTKKTTGLDSIAFSDLRMVAVPLPSVTEQRWIAKILDKADALRAKRRAALAHLDTLTQSIFLDMLGDTATKLNGWPRRRLQDVVKDGTIVTYGIVQAGEEYPGGVPYIRTGDIVGGEIVRDRLRHTDPAIAARFLRSRVEAGDIVMSIRATVGTTALVPPELDGANLTQGTARIAPGNTVDRSYLLNFLRAPSTQHWINLQIKGATFREITLARLRELPVAVPPIGLQREFARKVVMIEKLNSAQRTSLLEFDNLFTSLQHRALRGELCR